MKLHTATSSLSSTRCTHRTAGGRQCRLFVTDAHSSLCPEHHAQQKQVECENLYVPLVRNSQGFQTAQGINYSLSNLYELLAKNRISPRRAVVLSYISSLLLRTLPQIDADNAAGITDPTRLKPIDVPVSGDNTGKGSGLDSGADAHPVSDSGIDSHTDSPSSDTWDPSIPEPDPTRNRHDQRISTGDEAYL